MDDVIIEIDKKQIQGCFCG